MSKVPPDPENFSGLPGVIEMKGLNTETLWKWHKLVLSLPSCIHPWRPTDKLRNFHGWIAGIPGYLTHKPTRKKSAWKIAKSAKISLKMPLPTDAENCMHCRGICCAVYTVDRRIHGLRLCGALLVQPA
jgi:hypothetical protein